MAQLLFLDQYIGSMRQQAVGQCVGTHTVTCFSLFGFTPMLDLKLL